MQQFSIDQNNERVEGNTFKVLLIMSNFYYKRFLINTKFKTNEILFNAKRVTYNSLYCYLHSVRSLFTICIGAVGEFSVLRSHRV